MQTSDFEYELPADLIAQFPTPSRERARLLVLHRSGGLITHHVFSNLLDYLRSGDLLVLNDSRVIPARLRATKANSGGMIEVLLLEEISKNHWWAMIRPGKRVRPETLLIFHQADGSPTDMHGTVLEKDAVGRCRITFAGTDNVLTELDQIGEIPLPPYITRPHGGATESDKERYQTVFASFPGSVAAPTAGLHFSQSLLEQVGRRGVKICYVTLHVGLGTFAPVKTERISEHLMHEERFELKQETANAINLTRAQGGRVFAVGTTTLRVLESVAKAHDGMIIPQAGRTGIFIYPPYEMQIVDALITNFHLPRSTLLMLVSAFASPGRTDGRDLVLAAYHEAIRDRYRFFSYGDAMLVL